MRSESKRRGCAVTSTHLIDVAASFNVLLAEAAHNEVLTAMIQSFVSLMIERAPRVYRLEGFGEWDLRSIVGSSPPCAIAMPSLQRH